ncbi:hypothetical protein KIL84_010167 [Mauremys mutica]|uniref:Ig-like domain-containing protein n=1 Tax=Mauremys mutica TaxID=74926 RepID=A0A9D4B5S3_9SAUR|nr:hypothetical protein KIL84_010167 [Mauremys mutica]
MKIVSNTSRDPVQLACFISGFYPENLTVEWMEWMVDGQPRKLPSVTALATKDPNGPTYSTHCNASVSKADWRKVYLYTCQVSQPGTPVKSQGHTNKCREVIVSGEFCSEDGDEELDGLWSTISVFITLFLLSVCYSATMTLFKVKWLFSAMGELNQASGPEYKNARSRAWCRGPLPPRARMTRG